jgi:hypothetical protein
VRKLKPNKMLAVLPPRASSLLVTLLLIGGCASGGGAPGGAPGAPAAPAAVERFLQLARDKDYSGMAWVFGNSEGAIVERDPVAEVEQRMYALANLLEHDSFTVGDPSPVPGRAGDAVRFDVAIRRGLQTRQVPFTVVLGPQNRWFVEQLGVEALTSG